MKLILSLLILTFSLSVNALECPGYYLMKDGNVHFSSYPIPCEEAIANMKNGFFCQTASTFFDVNQRHTRVLPNGNLSCEYILEYLLVGDKYCPSTYDSYSFTTGYFSTTRPERCEDAIRK